MFYNKFFEVYILNCINPPSHPAISKKSLDTVSLFMSALPTEHVTNSKWRWLDSVSHVGNWNVGLRYLHVANCILRLFKNGF
jgi:hypothetical protein